MCEKCDEVEDLQDKLKECIEFAQSIGYVFEAFLSESKTQWIKVLESKIEEVTNVKLPDPPDV